MLTVVKILLFIDSSKNHSL